MDEWGPGIHAILAGRSLRDVGCHASDALGSATRRSVSTTPHNPCGGLGFRVTSCTDWAASLRCPMADKTYLPLGLGNGWISHDGDRRAHCMDLFATHPQPPIICAAGQTATLTDSLWPLVGSATPVAGSWAHIKFRSRWAGCCR